MADSSSGRFQREIEPGVIRDYTYGDVDVPLPDGTIDDMRHACVLYHRFMQRIVDPDARCSS